MRIQKELSLAFTTLDLGTPFIIPWPLSEFDDVPRDFKWKGDCSFSLEERLLVNIEPSVRVWRI